MKASTSAYRFERNARLSSGATRSRRFRCNSTNLPYLLGVRDDRSRLDDAVLESLFPGLGVDDVFLQPANDVVPVSLAPKRSAAVHEGGVEQLAERGEGAIISVMRRGGQEEQGVASPGQNLGKASSLRVLGVLDVAGVRAMVGLVDDDDVVAGPIELVEDPLLLQEVDRHEAEGDEVERIRAEFRAPPNFLELRPVDDFQSKPEALSHLETATVPAAGRRERRRGPDEQAVWRRAP